LSLQFLSISDFISLYQSYTVLDVRSPSEYNHAHIPGALNLPLFTDEERAVVGTAYKQESREAAIKIGLDYFGPKMREIVETVEAICTQSGRKDVIVHCWRGGMRSGAVAWLLDIYGFEVYVVKGGYKSFRKWCLEQFCLVKEIKVIGGFTGSGKTYLLHELAKQGEVVIDLEGLASHKGSAFGNIGMPDQPSQEMFENLLALEVYRKAVTNAVIWVEDESQRIGAINIPGDFYQKMAISDVYFLDIPFEERLNFIVEEYGKLPKEKLINATIRIQKRLGGMETKNAVQLLNEDNIKDAFKLLLRYYDKFYSKSISKKAHRENQVIYIKCDGVDSNSNAGILKKVSLKV